MAESLALAAKVLNLANVTASLSLRLYDFAAIIKFAKEDIHTLAIES